MGPASALFRAGVLLNWTAAWTRSRSDHFFQALQWTHLDLGARWLCSHVHQLAWLEWIRHALLSRTSRNLLLLDLDQSWYGEDAGAFATESLLDFCGERVKHSADLLLV